MTLIYVIITRTCVCVCEKKGVCVKISTTRNFWVFTVCNTVPMSVFFTLLFLKYCKKNLTTRLSLLTNFLFDIFLVFYLHFFRRSFTPL